MSTLKKVTLSGTLLSRPALAAYKSQHPAVTVEHDGQFADDDDNDDAADNDSDSEAGQRSSS